MLLQYNPIYEFHSDRSDITLQLTDSYKVRNEILAQLHRNANSWFELALGRAPVELQSTLQVCIFVISYELSSLDSRNTWLCPIRLLQNLLNWGLR